MIASEIECEGLISGTQRMMLVQKKYCSSYIMKQDHCELSDTNIRNKKAFVKVPI